MTGEEFRVALGRVAPSQLAFARLLTALGHPARDVARSVRRWCQIGPPGEVVVVLRLLEELAVPPPPATLRVEDDRDEPCGRALEPRLDALAERAVAAGWHPAEVAVAVLTWAAHRIADAAGEDAAVQTLEDAAEVVRLRG
jgi:hypothetical protein